MLPIENKIDKLAANVAYSMTGPLTEYLQDIAKSAGWPKNIIESMSVEFNGKSLFVNYPDNLASVIDDLEYGKPFGLPNPVIYPFIMRSASYVSTAFAETALDDIIELEGVF